LIDLSKNNFGLLNNIHNFQYFNTINGFSVLILEFQEDNPILLNE